LASSLSSGERAPSAGFKRFRLAFYLTVLVPAVVAGGGQIILLYWVVPYFTWLIFIMRIRSIAEHFAIDGESETYGRTRTTYAGVLARVFIAPKNVNYHIEHHFFPSVPFHRLPQLHAVLMSNKEFARDAHMTSGYAQMLKECLPRPTLSDSPNEPLCHQPPMLAAAMR
jgi:fatty acid desaturase